MIHGMFFNTLYHSGPFESLTTFPSGVGAL